ncbi:glycosyl hydrolase [Microbacterium sp. B35-04]|uniref:beta-L-arabinofuranosidase domain-containing protein n=1 Tax=unclassified Microbacterium TaxID=2609290 RepID=UPI0013D231F8|nr:MULTISPECIES: beta-L-arabinofuranosidase domain-containing protein [unclassified Microbacterium]KAF2413585.1 glycosyl hydrolase [Microbacterium sp. B35-04]KAF2417960.1 glycosyl hydrolase [Microbacterium sp. B35-30]
MSAATATRLALDFPLADVRLGETSVFQRARDEMLHLAHVYPIDRLLAVFRANSGLDTRGAVPPGSWEDFGHPAEDAWSEHDYPGREAAQTANLLRGHYAGHFLSMLAMAAAGEGDPVLHAKTEEFVAGLAEVQSVLAATGRYSHPGFLAAYGEWQFSRLEDGAPYGEIWAPYYTCHKIMAGLLDAHELVGSEQALAVARAMGRWVHGRLSRLDDARRQHMWSLYIAGEFGGMNETMTRLAAVADEPLFLETARMFDQHELVAAGASRRDILDGMHANQHLPQLIGYVHEYEATGERAYLDAAAGLWDQVVPGRMYAHGGTGESELWGPAGRVAGDIGHRNAETCATYNLLKLSRLLFQHTLDAKYMEYYERGALNHILGSRRDVRSETSPEVTYMFPVHPGALPEFDNVGTCCGGTGLENHVKYQDSVFFRGVGTDAELWINPHTPAELTWRERGLRIVLESELPLGSQVRIRVERTDGCPDPVPLTLHVRVPGWVGAPASARIGAEPVALDVRPGQYADVHRDWTPGEELVLELPMSLRAHATPDDPQVRHVAFGPSVLAARSDSTTWLEIALDRRRLLDGTLIGDDADPRTTLLSEGAVRVDGLPFAPVWTGTDHRYHLYVRSADATIGFAGVDTGVAARRREDGATILDDLWTDPLPCTRSAFVARVLGAVQLGHADSLLSLGEARTVLRRALELDAASLRGAWEDAPDVGPAEEWLEQTADVEYAASVPLVEILAPEPAASGWHTTPPQIRVRATCGEHEVESVEVRVGEDDWQVYTDVLRVGIEGSVRIEARATASGLTGFAARTLHIDTTPPVTEARVKPLGAGVEITFVARDDVSGAERIQWQGPGTFWATFQEAFVRALTDDEQIIEYAATDRAGNEEPRRRLVLPGRPRT